MSSNDDKITTFVNKLIKHDINNLDLLGNNIINSIKELCSSQTSIEECLSNVDSTNQIRTFITTTISKKIQNTVEKIVGPVAFLILILLIIFIGLLLYGIYLFLNPTFWFIIIIIVIIYIVIASFRKWYPFNVTTSNDNTNNSNTNNDITIIPDNKDNMNAMVNTLISLVKNY